MKTSFVILAIFSLIGSLNGQTNTVTYTTLSPDTVIRNPERGLCDHDFNFFSSRPDQNLDPSKLQAIKASNISLVYVLFYLENSFNTSLTDTVLSAINNSFTIIRNAGFKCVVRFGYQSNITAVGYLDPNKNQILQHISQLKPILVQNADVIYVMQAGFIGVWGEWHTSDNFGNGNRNKMSPTNYADRRAVLDAVLDALPSTRMVQERYPVLKRIMYNQTGPLADSDAYSGSAIARVGHHNQCFLASDDDMGTYINKTIDYPYLAQETKYVPQGGETCGIFPPRSDCPTALVEIEKFHWSYMDVSHISDLSITLANFQSQGCLKIFQNRLGYRFQLITSVFPTTASSKLAVQINLNNTGYAAPFNPRNVYLVFKNSVTQYSIMLKSNPNYWLPGPIVINESVSLASVNPGTYKLYLNLPDPEPTLSSIVDYSIQFANVGTWDNITGLNDLMQTINVTK